MNEHLYQQITRPYHVPSYEVTLLRLLVTRRPSIDVLCLAAKAGVLD